MSKRKEVTIAQLELGGFVVLERAKDPRQPFVTSEPVAAFSDFSDLSKGLAGLFGVKEEEVVDSEALMRHLNMA